VGECRHCLSVVQVAVALSSSVSLFLSTSLA
jgi:hypothetical protein